MRGRGLLQGTALLERAAARTEELPGAGLVHPFGPDWEVFKVRGKVFMLLTETTGTPMVILKAAPDDGRTLQEAYEHVTPGYHMNKKHWITLTPGRDIDAGLVDDLVTESYLLVVEKLPRDIRPVDPGRFGK
ncbi:MmcQ/YjbR family DNA-binding protein [Arthrobacter zhangbolii]|uniref:MmcQ/YjbR family DNA-binding protein n=1 Tax=Arthrobacter zhangbolii TaxID=2886936 RepID=A0A9X1S8R7_9MICC|nr:MULTISPECIES: MmcQ/YjbR family DNA-binding protein [Arthrobacter]MCC3271736.1 MmcQ/YjbR family DNA-binding protein [Arthrobacter zhangbolii]MDN3904808.1 MmcQ/YjbR family DNA-binding protein [Arthrobacter sp. YD2]UON93437.1 MmcQ/YjbR family DNA-binding protein [Arthrobacter zhangbolii]